MALPPRKFSVGEAALLLVALLHSITSVRAVSLRHHRLREPPAYASPSSDMVKALEYIESLKQRTDGAAEAPTGDYDEVDKFRMLVQLASLRDEDAARWPDGGAPQWVRAALRALEQHAEGDGATGDERRLHKSRRPPTVAQSPEGEYGSMVRPHKKYPLMFEDEENTREDKRATEDLDEQYTAQSLANMRSLLEELGRLQRKRDSDGDQDLDEPYRLRDVTYEDVVGGGEEWVPLEEQVETEELVKGSRQELERGLGDSEEESEAMAEPQRRRVGDPGQADGDDNDDDTKLVDYYLLKVLEMTDQVHKRDLQMEAQGAKRRPLGSSLSLNRPSLLDPRAIKQLLSAMSMKLQVPPEDLVGLLFMEETRKQQQQQRLPEPQLARKPAPQQQQQQQQQPRYRSRVIKYYNGRQPEVTVSEGPVDMKTEELLKALGLGNMASKSARYFTKPRPYKTAMSRYFTPSGRRGSLFATSDVNRAPSKRKDDYDDSVDEDEVATFLAAKLLTEYPDDEHKRAVDSKFPYEAYEEAMKDYFEQVDTGKSAPVKRDTQGKEEVEEEEEEEEVEEAPQKPPPGNAGADQSDQQAQESVTNGEKEHRGKPVAGM